MMIEIAAVSLVQRTCMYKVFLPGSVCRFFVDCVSYGVLATATCSDMCVLQNDEGGEFLHLQISYTIFLVIFSIVMLTNFKPSPNIHGMEYFMDAYVLTLLCEELRQVRDVLMQVTQIDPHSMLLHTRTLCFLLYTMYSYVHAPSTGTCCDCVRCR